MSLSVIASPPQFALVDNGLVFEIERSVFTPDIPLARFQIVFEDDFQGETGKYFDITFFGKTHTFIFVTTIDDIDQLPLWPAGQSREDFLSAVHSALLMNLDIISNYDILIIEGNLGFKLNAKTEGSQYNFTGLSKNSDYLTVNITESADQNIPDDYRIYAGLYNNDTSTPIAEEIIAINESLVASVNFASYAKAHLQTSFTFPFQPDELVKLLSGSVLPLRLRYADYYNKKVRLLNTGDLFYALPGGLSQADHDLLTLVGSDYFGGLTANYRFLNWCPDNKPTYWESPERLYLFNTEAEAYTIYAKILYAESTTETIAIGTIDTQYKIYEILCGLHEVKPDVDPSLVASYQVYAERDGTPLSETKTFVVNQTRYYRTRSFFFKNSFDVYEVITCTGQFAVSDDISRDTSEVAGNRVYRIKVFKSENLPKFTGNTGFFSGSKARNWAQEFLLSSDVYWIIGDALVPVVLSGGDIERESDDLFLYSASFEFTPDFRDQRYSAIINEGLRYLRDENFILVEDENGFIIEGW